MRSGRSRRWPAAPTWPTWARRSRRPSSGCWSTPGGATSSAAAGRMRALGTAEEDVAGRHPDRRASPTWSASRRCPTGWTRTSWPTLVEAFETRCADVVTARGGRVVKTLGDSVLFAADEPAVAIEIALERGREHRCRARPARRAGRPRHRPGRHAAGRRLRRAGQPGLPAHHRRPPQPGDRRRRRPPRALPTELFETRVLPARPMRGFGEVEPIAVRRRWRRPDRLRPSLRQSRNTCVRYAQNRKPVASTRPDPVGRDVVGQRAGEAEHVVRHRQAHQRDGEPDAVERRRTAGPRGARRRGCGAARSSAGCQRTSPAWPRRPRSPSRSVACPRSRPGSPA